MRRLNLFISDQLNQRLLALQEHLGLNLSELIRRAIDTLYDQQLAAKQPQTQKETDHA